MDKLIICTFLQKEQICYEELIPYYFPLESSSKENIINEASSETWSDNTEEDELHPSLNVPTGSVVLTETNSKEDWSF